MNIALVAMRNREVRTAGLGPARLVAGCPIAASRHRRDVHPVVSGTGNALVHVSAHRQLQPTLPAMRAGFCSLGLIPMHRGQVVCGLCLARGENKDLCYPPLTAQRVGWI